jgi:hypothetical protein
MRLVYFSYPLTKNPTVYREEARSLCIKLQELYPDLLFIIPHCTNLYNGRVEKNTKTCILALQYDIELIGRCDLFVLGKREDINESYGVCWELAYARILKKPIFYAQELLEGKMKVD